MNETLPIPCDACRASGMRQGAVCSECRGKGYRLVVNGKRVWAQRHNQQRQQHPHPGQERRHIR